MLKHPVKSPFQGIELDPGFMFQNSKDKQIIKSLESYNGHNSYLLLYCVKMAVMCGPKTKGKQPPILWLHLFLSRVRPSCNRAIGPLVFNAVFLLAEGRTKGFYWPKGLRRINAGVLLVETKQIGIYVYWLWDNNHNANNP